MLRYIYGEELSTFPKLRETMFRDRARQFSERLGWEVSVDAAGEEHDQYDAQNPLYVIWQRADGSHGGSMRFLPTTAPCMLNDHFTHLTDGVTITHPLIWECTRFCLAPEADGRVAGALMLGAAELGCGFRLTDVAGVFDARMVRIYGRLGWQPTVLGTAGQGREAISVGLWEVSDSARCRVARKAGLSPALSRHWFDRAFGPTTPLPVAVSA
ncbi:acyl-homoserine-lactone synthase [Oceanicola sp. 502str15]|uniref:acyl-homoserine-lactone synthase n=1 Tax=Oceanicola sp. 502str15 TaxID=2696061 RepID=UPI002094A2BE|nr:acyl-homoserine-lactone synthase [Oceanicola sp. 502str15]MCO6383220.1 autoinducer synthase [Oceanicola sp. 502str15]